MRRGVPRHAIQRQGLPAEVGNHREIFIYSDDAKQFGSHVRANLLEPLQSLVGSEQYGARFNGSSCDMAHFHVSEPLAYAFHKNKAVGIVFLDLVAAFASLRRRLAVPGDAVANDGWKMQLLLSGFTELEAI